MNLSQRLRTCAKHTGLDAVIELLQEAADEIDALQARAQVQGEPFGYIHHFAAHDESGALIDTTWEADGCADPLPHPTSPSMWEWTHCTPFYTTPQPAQATQVEVMDEFLYELWEQKYRSWIGGEQFEQIARAILALRPQAAPMTEEQAEELAYQAFKDHMEDRNDDMEIDLVRKVERFHRIGITAQVKKETP